MVRGGGVAMLWRAVDVLVTNREVRGTEPAEADEDEFDAVEQWLKNQREERQAREAISKAVSIQPTISITQDRKSAKSRYAFRKRSSAITVGRPSLPVIGRESFSRSGNNLHARLSIAPRSSVVPNTTAAASVAVVAAQRPLIRKKEWNRPQIIYHGTFSSDKFLDRSFMQQMQRRLLEQHEETLRRRIRERQAEEAQREKQLILAGIISPTHDNHNKTNNKRNISTKSARIRSPRPKTTTTMRKQKTITSNPQTDRGKKQLTVDDESIHDLVDELDEANTNGPLQLLRPTGGGHRPRLALLMQACRAVVGTHHQQQQNNTSELPTLPQRRGINTIEDTSDEISILRIKYESPLIAQLREVESVEELYSLAELIVSGNTITARNH